MTNPLPLSAANVPNDLLGPGARTSVAAHTCLLEGPAFDADGTLYFSDVIGNRMYRMTPGGASRSFAKTAGAPMATRSMPKAA